MFGKKKELHADQPCWEDGLWREYRAFYLKDYLFRTEVFYTDGDPCPLAELLCPEGYRLCFIRMAGLAGDGHGGKPAEERRDECPGDQAG